MNRRSLLLLCLLGPLAGCSVWSLPGLRPKKAKEIEEVEADAKLVGDLAIPDGLHYAKVEAIGLVCGLAGKGADPEPSPQRAMLIEEMRRRGVKNPNALLASRDVALVTVRGNLRPGIQKGDRFDIEVRVPPRTDPVSLRGGYLLETRLRDMMVYKGQLLEGKDRGVAQGPVLVDPSATEKDESALLTRGRVLGGAVAWQSRPLGLILRKGETTTMTPEQLANATMKSVTVQNAVNRRFHATKHGAKVGVATAKNGHYIELLLHPRYKDNVDRYLHVVRAIALRETQTETLARTKELEQQLLEPSTAAKAALQLEAIGTPAVDALLKGAGATDREVRFFSSEALAYLDRREAAKPLADIARNDPVFRVFALTALIAMEDYAAYDELRELLVVPSAETRYGAFRALWKMNPDDGLVKGEQLNKQFSYHVLDVDGPPMIHVTRNRRAEVVLFGQSQKFLTPLAVNAGNRILLNSKGGDEITVSRFAPNEADQKRVVSTRVDDVIRAIVELGGTYPDVVQALQEAKGAGCLEGRFEVEALPEAGRHYDRVEKGADSEPAEATPEPEVEKAAKKPGAAKAAETAKEPIGGGDLTRPMEVN